ncbi:MAG: thiopurine S-methyltransferase [Proteobacteria bacterium]|nr:thiopurine S-methyltransferase [Pseudomonadota bacterium]
MEIDFWLERWDNGQTGFHQQAVNPYLAYFYGEKGPAPEQRKALKVFVPLCGKSKDMLWLAQGGYQVFGVECSERAVKDFFEENALNYRHAARDEHALYLNDAGENKNLSSIEVYQGDFFSLKTDLFEDVSDVFDRASLIALPVDMRQQYADKMAYLLHRGTRILLVTLTYDQSQMGGPPFSVTEEEVNGLYAENFSVTKLCFKDIIDDEQRMKDRGLSSLVETVYKIVRL